MTGIGVTAELWGGPADGGVVHLTDQTAGHLPGQLSVRVTTAAVLLLPLGELATLEAVMCPDGSVADYALTDLVRACGRPLYRWTGLPACDGADA